MVYLRMTRILVGFAALALVTPVMALEVALIGDKSKRGAIERLSGDLKATRSRSGSTVRVSIAQPPVAFTVVDVDDPVAIANQVLAADVALLVVDSTQGPLPSVREQLIISRQARIPSVAVYFSNVRQLQIAAPKDAADLLELERAELRELLNKYEMHGDTAVVLFDADVSKLAKAEYPKGHPDMMRYLASFNRQRPARPSLTTVARFNCYYYLLTNPETAGKSVTVKQDTELLVWMEGRAAAARVETSQLHSPGDIGDFDMHLSSPVQATEGSRVLLVRNGATIGVGVVKRIIR